MKESLVSYQDVFEVLKQEPFAQFLGMKLVHIGEGMAQAELEVKEHMLNAHGIVHGAIIFSLADYAFAAASNSHGKTSVGISNNIHFMSAAQEGSFLRARAEEEKRNNRTACYRVHVESDGELIASMNALAYRKNHFFVSKDVK